MNNSYECVRCGHTNPFAHYVRAKWDKPVGGRCKRCGAAHSICNGQAEVISRVMMPSDYAHGVVSAWMLPWTRPVAIGTYECKFYDIPAPHTIFLWWNGQFFQVSKDDARRVQMREFQTWRGIWE